MNHGCSIPCTQYTIKSAETQYNFLGSEFVHENTLENRHGYIVEVRENVLSEELEESYTIISLIAELGGWCGICVGLSIVSTLESMLSSLLPNLKGTGNTVKKLVLVAVKIVCSVFLIYIAIIMILKYLKKELLTSVEIEGPVGNFNITVCSSTFLAEDVYDKGTPGLQFFYFN